jgi:hypothetical protein
MEKRTLEFLFIDAVDQYEDLSIENEKNLTRLKVNIDDFETTDELFNDVGTNIALCCDYQLEIVYIECMNIKQKISDTVYNSLKHRFFEKYFERNNIKHSENFEKIERLSNKAKSKREKSRLQILDELLAHRVADDPNVGNILGLILGASLNRGDNNNDADNQQDRDNRIPPHHTDYDDGLDF